MGKKPTAEEKKIQTLAIVTDTARATAPVALPRPAYLTAGQRAALLLQFKKKFRGMPPSTKGHTAMISEVATEVYGEIKGMPEFVAASEAIAALADAVAARYGEDRGDVELAIDSRTGLKLNHNTYETSGPRATDIINKLRNARNAAVCEEYEGRRASEDKARAAWADEKEEKELVIKTAPTIETVMALVPECHVTLPTKIDRDRMEESGYTAGQMTREQQDRPLEEPGAIDV